MAWPASRSALERAGLHLNPHEFLNSGVLAHPHLAFLGDVLATPSWVPLANVFSIGDVLILCGVTWGAHRACGSRVVPAWAGLPAAEVAGHPVPAPRVEQLLTASPTVAAPTALPDARR